MNQQIYSIIIFDGVCNFCNYWVNFIIDRDKQNIFKFAALQSEMGKRLLDKYNLPKDNFDSFILISDGEIFIKSSAAFEIAKHLNGWPNFFSHFKFLSRSFTDYMYNLVAKNRYKIFGKKDVCRIPSPEEKSKFL